MPNFWHIQHTKHKNGALLDVPNGKNYTTYEQYRCKFATVRTDVVKFLLSYITFSLSSLSSFSFFSPLSFSSSLSLLHFFLFSSLTLRFPLSSTSPKCLPSATTAQLRRRLRAPPSSILLQPLNLTLSHAPATLDLTDHTPRPPSISRSATLQPLCLSLVVGFFFFFFFFAAIWVDLMVEVGCGLWAVTVAMVVGCGGDGPLLSV